MLWAKARPLDVLHHPSVRWYDDDMVLYPWSLHTWLHVQVFWSTLSSAALAAAQPSLITTSSSSLSPQSVSAIGFPYITCTAPRSATKKPWNEIDSGHVIEMMTTLRGDGQYHARQMVNNFPATLPLLRMKARNQRDQGRDQGGTTAQHCSRTWWCGLQYFYYW